MNKHFMKMMLTMAVMFFMGPLVQQNSLVTTDASPSLEPAKAARTKHKEDVKNCSALIGKIEKEHKIPKNLLSAIAKVESRTRPWSIYARGRGYYFKSHEEASVFLRQHKAMGTKDLYVGCMQICMKSHGRKFKSIEDALNPHDNIRYAAKLLKRLKAQHGSWEDAVMHYNASSRKEAYKDKVLEIWENCPDSADSLDEEI
jgi:soluble lytic murein transglycosylase-like protein